MRPKPWQGNEPKAYVTGQREGRARRMLASFPGKFSYEGWETDVGTKDCRAKARELRQKARTVNDPTNRAHLLVMVAQYYWFAGWIEAQAHTPEQP